jgi:hypothetical protein
MKYLKKYKIFESHINISDVKNIISDVMNDLTDKYQYTLFLAEESFFANWYKKNHPHGNKEMIILEITPIDFSITLNSFHPSGGTAQKCKFTKEWKEMLISLSSHLHNYGYKSEVNTNVSNGNNIYDNIPDYINRVYKEKGRGGLLSGASFVCPFTIFIFK